MSKLKTISECLKNPESVLHACNQMHPISTSPRNKRNAMIESLIKNHLSNKWQSAAQIIENGGNLITDSLRITLMTKLNKLVDRKEIQIKKDGRFCYFRL